MTITNCDILLANDDWYNVFTEGVGSTRYDGSTTILFGHNNAVAPGTETTAYGDIDTSPIPDTDVISAATLYIYFHSYTVSKGTAKTYIVWMLSADDTIYTNIDNGTFTSAGWKSITLTAGEIAEIDKTGKSLFRFTVLDPGAGKVRSPQLRAREYVTVDSWDMYLAVTHAAPSSWVNHVTICTT